MTGLLLRLVRNFPCVTVILVAVSYAVHFFATQYLSTWAWLDGNPVGMTVRLVFHPVLHASWDHVIENTVFLVSGALVESWMTIFTRRTRWGILFVCYLVSLELSCLGLVVLTPTHRSLVGLSGMIFTTLGFAIAYCLRFHKRIRLSGWNLLALASMVLLLVIAALNTLAVLAGFGDPDYRYVVRNHLLALFEAVILGLVLFPRLPKDENLQRDRERT